MTANPYKTTVKDDYNRYIGKLEKKWSDIRGNELALCLGAGVTLDFVGEWNELLNKLALLRVSDTLAQQWSHRNKLPPPNLNDLFDYIEAQGSFFPKEIDVLEKGEYLLEDPNDFSYTRRHNMTDVIETKKERDWKESFFAEQVYHSIEKSLNEKIKNESLGNYFIQQIDSNDLVGKKDKKMETLRHVLGICLSGKVEHVINYNFDTILEKLLIDHNVCRKIEPCEDKWPVIEVYAYNDKRIRSLYNDRSGVATSSTQPRKILRIYHVHGIAHKDEEHPYLTQPLIFSENSYLEYQRTLLNWSQRRIADVMQNNNLLCIGFSGTDANFRYLARMMNTIHNNSVLGSDVENRIWITQRLHSKFLKDSKTGNPYSFACLEMLTESTTRYFKKHFNATILWAENFHKMADELKRIYS